jgi:hypothetical protein
VIAGNRIGAFGEVDDIIAAGTAERHCSHASSPSVDPAPDVVADFRAGHGQKRR